MQSKRLDRTHYWLALIGVIIVKNLLMQYLSGGTIWLDIALAALLAMRCHDFGLPTWIPVTLWLTLAMVLPVGGVLLGVDAEFIGLLGLPMLLVHFIVGFIPGNRGDNQYGAPGQGFAALRTVEEPAQSAGSVTQRPAASSNGLPRQSAVPSRGGPLQPRAAFGTRR